MADPSTTWSGHEDITASPALDDDIPPPARALVSTTSNLSSDFDSASANPYGAPHQQDPSSFNLEKAFQEVSHQGPGYRTSRLTTHQIHDGALELLNYTKTYQTYQEGLTAPPGETQDEASTYLLLPKEISLEAMTDLSWAIMCAIDAINAYDRSSHDIGHSTTGESQIISKMDNGKRQRRVSITKVSTAKTTPLLHYPSYSEPRLLILISVLCSGHNHSTPASAAKQPTLPSGGTAQGVC